MTAVLPEISFASYDPEEVLSAMIARFEAATGRALAQGDPIRLFLATEAAGQVQERFILDDSARNCLLAFAREGFLEALGDVVGVTRLPAAASTCTLEFTLAAAPGTGSSVTIPAGTRVAKDGTQLYWETDAELVIADLATTGTVAATCLTTGALGNDFGIGELTAMVDVVAGVQSAANTTITANGSDEEEDGPIGLPSTGLRQRIYLAPTAFSSAGPKDAYEFWARTASALISDVSVVSPTPGVVDVYVLLTTGIPDAPMLAAVEAVLSADTVRPLTDNVTAKAPAEIDYTIDVAYWIVTEDEARAAEIQAAVDAAVLEYIAWQSAAIGRDVNPSKLMALMMTAGAKRVEITTPVYAAVATTEVASLDGEAVVAYEGIEDE